MYDEEFDSNAPYDNVEFPARKQGTGTWPGPAGGGTGSAGVKLYGHQTTRGTVGGPSKLAPLVEVDGSSESNEKLSGVHFATPAQVNGAGATIGSSSSSSLSSSSSSAAKQTSSQSAKNQLLASKINPMSSQQNQTTEVNVGHSNNATSTTNNMNITVSSTPSSTRSMSTASVATTLSTTTASATSVISTISSSSSAGKDRQQTCEKNQRPVIKVTNDTNLYMPTEVTSDDGSNRKKGLTLKFETEEGDFKRHDLNPASRRALEAVYTQHSDFYQLNSKVLDEGSLLKQDILDIYRKTGETLTYEQLLQGMLVDGERFLLGSCWLYFTHVQFLDVEGTKVLREPYGCGRIGLTSKRALFLSTETYMAASLDQYPDGSKKTAESGYKLEVSKRSTVTFKNIPLSNFHSAEMEVLTGTAAQTKITKKHGCCSCLGIPLGSRWVSTPPMTRSISSRVVRVGVSMPPWQTRMFLDIHLDPSMSLTVARDFISQLHSFAPHMH